MAAGLQLPEVGWAAGEAVALVVTAQAVVRAFVTTIGVGGLVVSRGTRGQTLILVVQEKTSGALITEIGRPAPQALRRTPQSVLDSALVVAAHGDATGGGRVEYSIVDSCAGKTGPSRVAS